MRTKAILTWVSIILILIPTTTSSLAYSKVVHPTLVGDLVSPDYPSEQNDNDGWNWWTRFIMGFIMGCIVGLILDIIAFFLGYLSHDWLQENHQDNETLLGWQ